MEILRIPRIMQDTSGGHLMHGRSIGFVPTMGALHEGHLHLVRIARQENDITVVSIYINPLQFGPSEDFKEYPRDIETDTERLKQEGVDILFLPDNSLIYPKGFSTYVEVDALSGKLCGAFRPGHFRGVATVVAKLFNIVRPVRAYFGQKDFQQTVIIKRLAKDLDMGIDVVACPTVREEDGLAMSSRNASLNQDERKAAAIIYRSLKKASESVESGIIRTDAIKKLMKEMLMSETLISEVQYCSAYDTATLDEIGEIGKEALLAVAVKIGSTRLIDNMLVTISCR